MQQEKHECTDALSLQQSPRGPQPHEQKSFLSNAPCVQVSMCTSPTLSTSHMDAHMPSEMLTENPGEHAKHAMEVEPLHNAPPTVSPVPTVDWKSVLSEVRGAERRTTLEIAVCQEDAAKKTEGTYYGVELLEIAGENNGERQQQANRYAGYVAVL